MKKLLILICLILTANTVYAEGFTDTVNDGYGAGSAVIFDDIENVPWAHEAIEFFVTNGLIKQNFENKLYPNKHITREEFVDLLISSFGIYEITATCDFTDISEQYYGVIATANKNGIVNGISETEFGFGQKITRQDLVTMSSRILSHLDIETVTDGDLKFDDKDDISSYAYQSVLKLTTMGIINGDNLNCFNPKNFTTRAEAYKIIYLLRMTETIRATP
ncbi:MAG: S-layer homology domain-containing protein [Clostridia bacterium]|nr:S-layer homology domain-containing protein [Clostridia bacterium]